MDYHNFSRQEWKTLGLVVSSVLMMIVGIILIISSGSSTSGRNSPMPTSDRYALTEKIDNPDPSTAIRTLWPDGRVPYTMDAIIGDKSKTEILKSIEIFHEKTCVRFEPKTNLDEYWIGFVPSSTLKCSNSPLGLDISKKGMKKIILGEQCIKKPTIEIFLARTLGLDFEETRPDRDNYIRLDSTCELGNISTNIPIGNHNQAALDIFFDYTSHMFRKSECFEPVQNGRINFGSSDDDNAPPGTLSVLDIEKLNAMYNCSGCQSYRFLPLAKVLDPTNTLESHRLFVGGRGIYNNSQLYICRVYHLGDILIGKATSGDKKHRDRCWVEYYGREHPYDHSFEVLSSGDANLNWKPADGSTIPTNAVIGGRTADRKPVYIGRCRIDFGLSHTIVTGSVFPNVSVLKVPFNHMAKSCSTYDILVCGD